MVLDFLHQPEIGHFHAAADNQQILRLDVQVLERIAFAHVVQGVGRIAEIDQQFFSWDAGVRGRAAGGETIFQARVGQLGDNHKLAVHDLDPLQGKQEGVTHLLDPLESLQLAGGPVIVQTPVDELDGFAQSAGCATAFQTSP